MEKFINIRDMITIIIMVITICTALFLYDKSKPKIVAVDVLEIIEKGKVKFKTAGEIKAFSKKINIVLSEYAKENNAILISKQVIIGGTEDVTKKLTRKIFNDE